MKKKYTRRHISNLQSLDNERERLRGKAKKMEEEWMDTLLDPKQLAIGLVTNLWNRKRASKARKQNAAALLTNRLANAPKKIKQQLAEQGVIKKQSGVKRMLKATAVSFLKWQLFNLALYVGKKSWRAIREKRSNR